MKPIFAPFGIYAGRPGASRRETSSLRRKGREHKGHPHNPSQSRKDAQTGRDGPIWEMFTPVPILKELPILTKPPENP